MRDDEATPLAETRAERPGLSDAKPTCMISSTYRKSCTVSAFLVYSRLQRSDRRHHRARRFRAPGRSAISPKCVFVRSIGYRYAQPHSQGRSPSRRQPLRVDGSAGDRRPGLIRTARRALLLRHPPQDRERAELYTGGWDDAATFATHNAFVLALIGVFLAVHHFDDHQRIEAAVRRTRDEILWPLLALLWVLAITVSQGSSAKFIYFDF